MEKSTKEQFYNFVEHILDEVDIPPQGDNAIVTENGKKGVHDMLIEYDENLQLRVILTIIRCLAREGKLPNVYWLLRSKYLEYLE